jgi:hypothetical protein
MKKIFTFIDTWGIRIITPLTLIIFLKTCSTNGKIATSEKKVMRELDSLTHAVDSLDRELNKEIKLEGLRSEKRMIQSTDRKMLDVTRQSEIDREISSLEK